MTRLLQNYRNIILITTNNKKTSNNIDLKVVLAKFQNLEKLYLDSRCMIYIIEENNLLANL